MNGLTKFFTFIFEKGRQNEKVKAKISEYVDRHSFWCDDEDVDNTVKQFHNYIYKKNGEYRKGGEELYKYIQWCHTPPQYRD